MVSQRRSLVITQMSSGRASGCRRSTVHWIMVRSPSRARTCLARALRLRGQKRVPLPPARMMGRKSIFKSGVLFRSFRLFGHARLNANDGGRGFGFHANVLTGSWDDSKLAAVDREGFTLVG